MRRPLVLVVRTAAAIVLFYGLMFVGFRATGAIVDVPWAARIVRWSYGISNVVLALLIVAFVSACVWWLFALLRDLVQRTLERRRAC